jgi:hypothetical protein
MYCRTHAYFDLTVWPEQSVTVHTAEPSAEVETAKIAALPTLNKAQLPAIWARFQSTESCSIDANTVRHTNHEFSWAFDPQQVSEDNRGKLEWRSLEQGFMLRFEVLTVCHVLMTD